MTVKSAQALGIAIKLKRRSLKLTQQNVASVAGVERAVVGRLERARDDTAQFRVVLLVVNALDMDIELRPRDWTPDGLDSLDLATDVTELGLSASTVAYLRAAEIYRVGELGSADELIRLYAFSGTKLYEIVCALNRHGLSLPTCRDQKVPKDREREVFRLRVLEGLTLTEIGERVGVTSGRVRQILSVYFGLKGTPPAVKEHKRTSTARRRAERRSIR